MGVEGDVDAVVGLARVQQQWEQPPHHGAARLPGGAATAALRRVSVPGQPPVALASAFWAATALALLVELVSYIR